MDLANLHTKTSYSRVVEEPTKWEELVKKAQISAKDEMTKTVSPIGIVCLPCDGHSHSSGL